MKVVYQIAGGIVLGYIGVTLVNAFVMVPLALFVLRF